MLSELLRLDAALRLNYSSIIPDSPGFCKGQKPGHQVRSLKSSNLAMVVGAVRCMKVAVGSVQVAVHAVQVPVGPCLGGGMMTAPMVSAVSGVEAGIGSMISPVRAVIPAVGIAGVLGQCGRGRRQQEQKDGGCRQS